MKYAFTRSPPTEPGTNVFRPRSAEHPEDESFPGLLLRRVEGRVFFLNAARIGEKIRAAVSEAKPNVVALDLSGVFDFEYTALKALIEAQKRLAEDGIAVWLVGLGPAVLRVIDRSVLRERLGREQMHFNLEIAVRHYLRGGPNGSADRGTRDTAPHHGAAQAGGLTVLDA
jgi:MFS superfamily sulfate permease-like transporter